MENENRNENGMRERKPIKPISSITSRIVFKGFWVGQTKYGTSVLLFDEYDNAYSLSGFAGRQFVNDNLDEELKGREFFIELEKKFSKKYGKDYYIIKDYEIV